MHSTSKFDYSRRTRILNGVVTLLYFLILCLVLYELDRQHYTGEKEALIREHFREIFDLPDSLAEQAGEVLFSTSPIARKVAAERLREQMRAIVEGPSSIFSFELLDANRQVVEGLRVVDPEKPKRLNNWRNSLFLRNFERITDLGVKRERGTAAGRLVARYTTPANYAPIEELTRRYWLIVAWLVGVWLVGYYFLYRYILRPMYNVTSYLQASQASAPRLIAKPSAGLESAYNAMALKALLQQLNEAMSELLRSNLSSLEKPLSDATEFIRDSLYLEWVCLQEYTVQDGELLLRWEVQRASRGRSDLPRTTLLPPMPAEEVFRTESDGSFFFCAPLGANILVFRGRLAEPTSNSRLRFQGIHLAATTILRGLVAHNALRQLISEERSQANISLARSLGHDLTNILSSVKLDISSLLQITRRHPEEISPEEWSILRDCIENIENTARLAQEIVDLYRSFSYIKHPEYVRYNLNKLLEEFINVYKPTTSLRVEFVQELSQDMPDPIIERRLLKLALFNVVTNAMDAFRSNRDNLSDVQPRIILRTRYSAASNTHTIEIEDNGPGIRDARGKLLGRGEIDVIFQFGYSTKSELSEGFGLYWVRTIIERFHYGKVMAMNLPEGGAKFILEIRSMESEEARIKD